MNFDIGDLVRYTEDAQWFGVIIEIVSSTPMGSLRVFWNDGDLSWIGTWKVEVLDESR